MNPMQKLWNRLMGLDPQGRRFAPTRWHGFGGRATVFTHAKGIFGSKYKPHQGPREKARRRRQLERGIIQ